MWWSVIHLVHLLRLGTTGALAPSNRRHITVAAPGGLVVPSLGVPAGVIVGALGPARVGRGNCGTIRSHTPARLARRASTKLLVRIMQLVKLLLLQGGQFLILFIGVVTVHNFAGGKFFCTEDALAAVPPSMSMAGVTSAGPAGTSP